jgi:hypothetical protein
VRLESLWQRSNPQSDLQHLLCLGLDESDHLEEMEEGEGGGLIPHDLRAYDRVVRAQEPDATIGVVDYFDQSVETLRSVGDADTWRQAGPWHRQAQQRDESCGRC